MAKKTRQPIITITCNFTTTYPTFGSREAAIANALKGSGVVVHHGNHWHTVFSAGDVNKIYGRRIDQ